MKLISQSDSPDGVTKVKKAVDIYIYAYIHMYIIYKYASNSYERGRLKNDEKIIPEMYRAIRYTNTCPLFHYSTIICYKLNVAIDTYMVFGNRLCAQLE